MSKNLTKLPWRVDKLGPHDRWIRCDTDEECNIALAHVGANHREEVGDAIAASIVEAHNAQLVVKPPETVTEVTREVREMSVEELLALFYECKRWIDGPENDGRLTTGSSAQLDLMMDTVEEVNAELERRIAPGYTVKDLLGDDMESLPRLHS